jgi:hypothetical protein
MIKILVGLVGVISLATMIFADTAAQRKADAVEVPVEAAKPLPKPAIVENNLWESGYADEGSEVAENSIVFGEPTLTFDAAPDENQRNADGAASGVGSADSPARADPSGKLSHIERMNRSPARLAS